MPSPVVQVRVPAELLAQIDAVLDGETTSAWIRDAIVRKLGGSLDLPTRTTRWSPEVKAVVTQKVREDPELERRRKIAATHKPGCKCLNCIA